MADNVKDATPQEHTKWNRFVKDWQNKSKRIERLLILCEFAGNAQVALEGAGWVFTKPLFDAAHMDRLQKLLNAHNKIERVISKVQQGVYPIRFANNDIDVVAVPGMKDDIYADDIWTGFSGVVTAVIIIGLIVGAIWGTAEAIDNHTEMIEAETRRDLVQIDKEMARAPKPIIDAWIKLKETNKPKLKAAGWFDKIFGGGSGALAISIGGAILALSLLMSSRRKN